MTFRQQAKHPHWFRLVTGGLLAALVAACAVAPVTVVGSASALTAVQSNFAIGVGQEKDLLPFVRVAGSGMIPLTSLCGK
jgi:hypothetical protein